MADAKIDAARRVLERSAARAGDGVYAVSGDDLRTTLAALSAAEARVATAYYDGFCDGIMRQPWEAAADYAAVMGQAYAKTGERPQPFIPVIGPGPDEPTWLQQFRDLLGKKRYYLALKMLRQPATPLSAPVKADTAETGWLIEEFSTSTRQLKARWWDGDAFTADSGAAIRFARREDAQKFIDNIGWTEGVPTEHRWG